MKVPTQPLPSVADQGTSPLSEARNQQASPENLLMAAATMKELGRFNTAEPAKPKSPLKTKRSKILG